MAQITIKSAAGKDAGTVDLDDAVFGIQPNVPVMHQVVTAQLAARRSGSASTKTRSEVRGGGAKPYRQKGTGNARQGSIRAPHYSRRWRRDGPQAAQLRPADPEEDDQARLALGAVRPRQRGQGARRRLLGLGRAPRPRTPSPRSAALGVDGRVLVVVGRDDAPAALSFRNIPEVQLIAPGELNAYDVLCNDWIVFTEDTLPTSPAAVEDAPTTDAAKARRREGPPPRRPAPKPTDVEAGDDRERGHGGRRTRPRQTQRTRTA